MNALPIESVARPGTDRRGAGPKICARYARLSAIGLGGLMLLIAGGWSASGLNRAALEPASAVSIPAADASKGLTTMPSTPLDGVLTLVIPPGAAADQRAGGRGYEMPPVISLEVGEKIVIRNDDDAGHMILFAFVEPGETVERVFTEPGSEVYSSGCGLHGASFLNFTSIFIGESA
jgi:hypothetical protein